MCGIAGIVYKEAAGDVGRALLRMLGGCQHRGPDSTGLALYGDSEGGSEAGTLRLRLFLGGVVFLSRRENRDISAERSVSQPDIPAPFAAGFRYSAFVRKIY